MGKGSEGFKENEYLENKSLEHKSLEHECLNEPPEGTASWTQALTSGTQWLASGTQGLAQLEPWKRWGISFSALALTAAVLTACAAQSPAGNRASAAEGERSEATRTSSAPISSQIPPAPGSAAAIAPTAPTPPETMALAATTTDADLLTKQLQGDHQGRFRVGNQTQHPLRIAFLQQSDGPQTDSPSERSVTQKSSAAEAKSPAGAATTMPPSTASPSMDLEPIHWDFAPGEGGQSGLLLSVPQGDVELRSGDVLVAFAQDGSRRYWGPYVVGQTQLPYWNEARSEWQLLIQP